MLNEGFDVKFHDGTRVGEFKVMEYLGMKDTEQAHSLAVHHNLRTASIKESFIYGANER